MALIVLSVAEYNITSTPYNAGDEVIIRDTGANLSGLDFAGLDATGVDAVEALSGVITLNVTQAKALATSNVTLLRQNTITVQDSGANLATLSGAEISQLSSQGVDVLDAADGAVTFGEAQAKILASSFISFFVEDEVTVTGVFSNFSSFEITLLNSKGVDIFDAASPVVLSATAAKALAATGELGIKFNIDNSVMIRDTGANLATISGPELNLLGDKWVRTMDATDDVLNITISQYTFEEMDAFGVSVTTADFVTIKDIGANFLKLWPWGWNFRSPYIDALDVTDNVLRIGDFQASYLAEANISFAPEDVVTVEGDVGTFSANQIASLSDRGVDEFDANGSVTLNAEQAHALAASGIRFVDSNEITVADDGEALAELTTDEILALKAKGVDSFIASGNTLVLSLAELNAIGSVDPNTEAWVVLADSGAALSSLPAAVISDLWERGVNAIDATDDTLIYTVAQFDALGPIMPSDDDVITLWSNQSYILPEGVTNLVLTDGAISGIGNSLDNTITGTAAVNRINGRAGADRMIGGAGSDTYHVDNTGDRVVETASGGAADRIFATISYTLGNYVENLHAIGSTAIDLTGSKFGNVIYGNSSNNEINGRYGNDILKGGLGRDVFIFDQKLSKKANLDKILDFNVKDDALWLDNVVFKKLGSGTELKPGKLKKAFFTVGDQAKDANDYLFYDKKTGVLFYDIDGSGSAKAVEIVKLAKHLKITSADVFII